MLKETNENNNFENEIKKTSLAAQESFYKSESKRILSFAEFLIGQANRIKKIWWLLQVLLLACITYVLHEEESYFSSKGNLSVCATLFIILLVPELWKNKEHKCVEIENSTFYSIRQIYTARLLVIGLVDVLIVTPFVLLLRKATGLGVNEIVIFFLIPMIATSAMVLILLSINKIHSQWITIVLCLVWAIFWWQITNLNTLYLKFMNSAWAIVFAVSIFILVIAIRNLIVKDKNF